MTGQAWGLILAAGRGARYGRPKQFVRVKGRPLVWYSMRAFERCPEVAGWTVVTLPGRVEPVRRLAGRSGFGKLKAVVAGGRRRADSVALGLATLPERGLVAVHDAARPLVTPAMLSAGFAACRRTPVAFAAPVTDTLKRAQGNRITGTVDRTGLWAVQTPQFFPLALLRRAHRLPPAGKTAAGRPAGADSAPAPDGPAGEATDDCELVERLGVRPRLIAAPGPNPKVTFAGDARLVRGLL